MPNYFYNLHLLCSPVVTIGVIYTPTHISAGRSDSAPEHSESMYEINGKICPNKDTLDEALID